MNLAVMVACICLVGCISDAVIQCEDGRLCPPGTVCDNVHAACVAPEQLTACAGLTDGDLCELFGSIGECRDGVCFAAACGDGFIQGAEDCDGSDLGNTNDCRELGYYDSASLSCSAVCTFDTSACTGLCGDAVVNGPEVCDLNDTTCQDLGFANGNAVSCTPACTWDTSDCSN